MLASAAAAIRQKIRVPIEAAEHDRIERTLSESRSVLSPEDFDRAWAHGLRMRLEELTEIVRS
jgi:hypothetical protein